MTDKKARLLVGKLTNGRFVAVATGAPYFCTVGDSPEAVLARARAASVFYRESLTSRHAVQSPTREITKIVPSCAEPWPDHAQIAPAE